MNEATEIDEDPLVMYFAVRQSLDMGAGKIASQCAHAAQMILLDYQLLRNYYNYDGYTDNYIYLDEAQRERVHHFDGHENRLHRMIVGFSDWLDRKTNGSFRKVVLKAKDKDWDKLKELDHILVQDAGLTEVAPNSETVIVLYPMRKSARPKFLQKLRVL